MSDGLDLGQHGGYAAGGAATLAAMITTGIARIFRARDEEKRAAALAARETAMLVELAEIKRDLAHALSMLAQQGTLSERVAKLELLVGQQADVRDRLVRVESQSIAAHDRLDRIQGKRD